jgi:bacterial/archaeal transporter family-2 protein
LPRRVVAVSNSHVPLLLHNKSLARVVQSQCHRVRNRATAPRFIAVRARQHSALLRLGDFMPYLTALAAGIALGVQVVINARLGAGLGGSLWASLASLQMGALALLLVQLLTRVSWPATSTIAEIPIWGWCGGLLGAVYLTGVVSSAARLGAASTVALVVFGQMTMALLLDHLGILVAPHPASPLRILGGLFLFAGVLLATRA